MPVVRFQYADMPSVSFSEKKRIKRFIIELFFLEGKGLNRIDYIFCSDHFLLEINRSFLKHDYYTDIITFELGDTDLTTGEIYISVERVKENAAVHGCSFKEELLRVIFHGALHLCGYMDKKKSEITIMRQKEEEYLRLFEKK